MESKDAYILDSFALLAYLASEPGADEVASRIQFAQNNACLLYMPVINLGETLYIIERRAGVEKASQTLALIRQLPVEILPADERSVLAAAHIKANFPISYADAFIVAAAQDLSAVILTGDPEFKHLENIAQIEWIIASPAS